MPITRRALAVPALVLGAAALAGCMHVQETVDVSPNGTSEVTATITYSPQLLRDLGGTGTTSPLSQFKQHQLPGQVSVSRYTDASGWQGVKVTLHETSLAELQKLETSSSQGAAPLFKSFVMTHNGKQWSVVGTFDKSATDLSQAAGKVQTLSVAQLKATGFSYDVTLVVPGRVVQDNATSRKGNVLTWALLDRPASLKASWVAP